MSKETPLNRTVDELELQAWLARAEFRNPSLHEAAKKSEVDALARLRDELRVQLALGRLDARDEWAHLESRWAKVKQVAESVAHEAGESLHDVLHDIREGYRKLRS